MEILNLISDLMPSVLSIIAVLVAFLKGKTKKELDYNKIAEVAEKKKQNYIKRKTKGTLTPVIKNYEDTYSTIKVD